MKHIYILFTFLILSFASIAQNAADYYTASSNALLQDMTGAQILIEDGIDDYVTDPAALPFAFSFAGTSYTQFSVSSNGLLGFGSTSVSYGWYNNDYVDKSIVHSDTYPIVMPWGDDLTTDGGGVSYLTEGTEGSRKFIIQWRVNQISDGVNYANKTFQVWLYEGTNAIRFVYGDGNSEQYYNASVGIATSSTNYKSVNTSNDTFNSTMFDNNQTWPGTGKSYLFSPTPIPQFQPLAFSSEITVQNVTCFGENNGSVTLGTVTGGDGNYTYSWSGPGGYVAAGASINSLAPGTYTYIITDGAASAPLTGTVTITEPEAIILNATATNVSCFGANNGSIQASADGAAIVITKDGADVTSSNGSYGAGTYIVTAANNGCSVSQTVEITEPAQIVVNATATNVSCFGANNGSIQASADGAAIVITKDGADVTSSNGSYGAGTYIVTAANNGCSVSQTVEITEPAQIVVNATATNVSCFGANNGSIQASADGAAMVITKDGTDVTASNGSYGAGTYIVTAANNGCSASQTVEITEPTQIVVNATATNVSCFGANNGSIQASAGGAAIVITKNGTDVTASNGSYGAGTYVVTASNNGCNVSQTVEITEPAQIVVNATATNVSCFGASNGSIQASASGATLVITKNGSNVTASNGSYVAGTYVVTSSNNGCSASQTVQITEPAQIIVNATATNVSCFGANNGSIQASSGGATLVITKNGTNVTASNGSYGAGTYIVTASNNGCSASKTVQITEPALITLTATAKNVSCFGANNGSIQVSSTGSQNIVIKKGTSDVTASNGGYGAGTYTVTASNNGCSLSKTVQITEPSKVTVSATTTEVSCNASANGKITVTVSQGATYVITNAQGVNVTSAAGYAPGVYTIKATGAGNCTATTTVTVTKANPLTMGDIKINPVYTSPKGANANTIYLGYGVQSVTLSAGTINGGSNSYAYAWSPSTGLNKTNVASVTAKPVTTTTYTLTVTDNVTKCTTTETFTLNVVDVRTGNNKILVCHNGSLISLNSGDVSSHLNHGDYLGTCAGTPSTVSSYITNIINLLSDKIDIYPNPTGGQFNVTIKEMGTRATINIINSNGQSVSQMTVQLNGKPQSFGFNLSNQPAGLYYVTVVSDEGVQIDKVVIQ